MTNNLGLTFSVGDAIPWFTIIIDDTNVVFGVVHFEDEISC